MSNIIEELLEKYKNGIDLMEYYDETPFTCGDIVVYRLLKSIQRMVKGLEKEPFIDKTNYNLIGATTAQYVGVLEEFMWRKDHERLDKYLYKFFTERSI